MRYLCLCALLMTTALFGATSSYVPPSSFEPIQTCPAAQPLDT